mmetsp:Transcript_67456/g.123049  ORF Transcript_67456/g.123049 Transcript_67456/m.123049 type:complete len:81 (+) Transcript_67456:186-428(+)
MNAVTGIPSDCNKRLALDTCDCFLLFSKKLCCTCSVKVCIRRPNPTEARQNKKRAQFCIVNQTQKGIIRQVVAKWNEQPN